MPKFSIFKRHEEGEETISIPTSSLSNPSVDWYSGEYEGQLSVDVYQTKESLVIKSTIAGVKSEDLEITLNNDVITIRGKRYHDADVSPDDYFYRECYWGGFSRSIVLPVEVKSEKIEANLKNGILTVVLPKANKTKAVLVKVAEQKED